MKKAILISCFDWYEKRLRLIEKKLSDKYDVTVLTSDFIHITKERIVNKNPRFEYIHVPSYRSNISLARIASHLLWGMGVKKRMDELRPDLIYILLPPNNAAYYILKYRLKYNDIKIIVDIIDLWPESLPVEFLGNNPIIKIWKNWRDKVVKSADAVVVECDYYKTIIQSQNPIYTLYLFKEQTKNEIAFYNNNIDKWGQSNLKNIAERVIILGYVGSINNIIDIEEIVNIVTILSRKYTVNIKIIGEGENQEKFIDCLKKTEAIVRYYGPVYDELSKMEILGNCHFGLNIRKKEVSVGLSIKSIDYFSYGLPIINNVKGDTWSFVENNNIGFNVDYDKIDGIGEISNWIEYRKSIRKFFEQRFSVMAAKKTIEDMYNNISEERIDV